jgi:uncharacterized protein (TIGR03382 family)
VATPPFEGATAEELYQGTLFFDLPEPSSLALCVAGLGLAVLLGRRSL